MIWIGTERRKAGAKVVDGDAYIQSTNRVQAADAAFEFFHDDALGDSECQPACGMFVAADGLLNLMNEVTGVISAVTR